MFLRIPAAILLVLLAVLTGCSSDDPEEPEPSTAPVPAVTPAPDLETVRTAVREAADLSALPEDVLPPVFFVPRDNSLLPRDQSCVLGYLSVARETPCLVGDLAADREVMLWGDVHAAQWIPALDLLGRADGWRVHVRVKYGCPPLAGTTPWLEAEGRPYVECAEFNARTLATLAESPPEAVLLTGAVRGTALMVDGAPVPLGRPAPRNGWRLDPAGDGLWQRALRGSLDEIDALGARAVVLGDTPYPGRDAQTCLTRNADDLQACSAGRRSATYQLHRRSSSRTAEEADADYVDTRSWFCTRRTCPPVVEDLVVYRDGFTVGRLYSTYLSTVLGRAAGLIG